MILLVLPETFSIHFIFETRSCYVVQARLELKIASSLFLQGLRYQISLTDAAQALLNPSPPTSISSFLKTPFTILIFGLGEGRTEQMCGG